MEQLSSSTSQKVALKERMEERKSNFELVVKTHTDMIGIWLTSTAPSVSQAIAALTIGFAVFDGLTHFFGMAWYFALLAGMLAAWAIEGTGFTAVDERDQSTAHNRRTADSARHLNVQAAEGYVTGTFVITLLIVLVAEVAPAFWNLYKGTADVPEVLFRCSLLLFPFLSRLGAQLYAFRSVRLAADTSADDQELRVLQLELTKKEMIAASELRVKSQRKNARNYPTQQTVKHPETEGNNQEITPNIGYLAPGNSPAALDGRQRKIAERHNAIVELIQAYGPQSAPELSTKLMSDRGIKASDQTVGDDCRHLVASGRLVMAGRKWDVSQAVAPVPEPVEFSTNGHGKHKSA